MPRLNHTGPFGEGEQTGRGLGRCSTGKYEFIPEKNFELGKGMGLRRRKTTEGDGQGKGMRRGQ